MAFLGDSLYHNGYRMVGENYDIDWFTMNHGETMHPGTRTRRLLGSLANRRKP